MSLPAIPDFANVINKTESCGELPLVNMAAGYTATRLLRCAGCSRWSSAHYGTRFVSFGNPDWRTTCIPTLRAMTNAVVDLVQNGRIYCALAHLTAHGILQLNMTIGGTTALASAGPFETTSIGNFQVTCITKTGEEFIDPTVYPTGIYPVGILTLGNSILSARQWIIRSVSWTAPFTPGDSFTVHLWTPIGGLADTPADGVNIRTATLTWYNTGAAPAYPACVDIVDDVPDPMPPDPRIYVRPLIRSGPIFRVEQAQRSIAIDIANPETYVAERVGDPAVDNLTDELFQADGGPLTVQTNYAVGKWGIPSSYEDAGGKTHKILLRGPEVSRYQADGTAPAFLTPSTWPPDGPGASAQSAPLTGLGQALTGHDPYGRLRVMALAGGSGTINLDNPSSVNHTSACSQQFARMRVYVPQTVAGVTTSEYGRVTYQDYEIGSTHYPGLFEILRGRAFDPTKAFPAGTLVTNVTPVAIVDNEDGTVTILIDHATDTLGYWDTGGDVEATVQFRHGGLHVSPPQRFRITNYKSGCAYTGDGRTDRIEPGDGIKLTSTDGATIPAALEGCLLAIDQVTAYDQAVSTPSFWRPNPPEGWTTEDDDAWYTTNISGREGLPAGFVNWGKSHATIRVVDENAAIMTLIGKDNIIGHSFPVYRHAVMCKPGYLALSHGAPAGESDTPISAGYLFFAAWGRIYTPATYVGECLIADVDLRMQDLLTHQGNFLNAAIATIRAALGGTSFTITALETADTRIYSLATTYTGQSETPSYYYSEVSGATSSRLGTAINGEDPARQFITTYSNLTYPFFSAELCRAWFGEDAVTAGHTVKVQLDDLAMTKTTYHFIWSSNEWEGASHGEWVAAKGMYHHVYFETENPTSLSLNLLLVGINYDGTGKPEYKVLATTGAGLDETEDGIEITYETTDLVKAILTNRNDYQWFGLFVGVAGYAATPGLGGEEFMYAMKDKTLNRDITREEYGGNYYAVGTVEGTDIQFSSMVVPGGVLTMDQDELTLETGEV